MEQAWIARIAVSAVPYAIDLPYDYTVPEKLRENVLPGVRVMIPFGQGNQKREGIVLSVGADEKVRNYSLKAVLEVLDRHPVLDADAISLALWMRQRYFCTVFDACRVMLPAGLWYHMREIWHIAEPSGDKVEPSAIPGETESSNDTALSAENPPGNSAETFPAASGEPMKNASGETSSAVSVKTSGETVKLPRAAREILSALREHGGKLPWEQLQTLFGDIHPSLRMMERAGLVYCETVMRRNAADKMRPMAELALSPEELMDFAARTRHKNSTRYEVVKFLAAAGRASCADISYYTGADLPFLRKMEQDGLLIFTMEEEFRLPETDNMEPSAPVPLNEEQQNAFEQIRGDMEKSRPGVTLLQGVTGSGKTLIYLYLVREALDRGKTAIVLVPEIILTPQIMRQFTAWFGTDVAMLHSSLRLTERYDQWKRIRAGKVHVVLGTRSAIFAPLHNVGLIAIDEEQEDTYRSGMSPRYDAREIAKYLCARDDAVLVLGSATPSVESAWNAEQGRYRRVVLTRRYHDRAMPTVLIADWREEIRSGNSGTISAVLRAELEKNFAAGEQSILFLNRRGHDRMLLCAECGYVPECSRCSAPLTFHSANGRLMCHYCGHSEPAPEQCPSCGGIMKHIGAGTQKVEEEFQKLYPGVELLRMDLDTAAGKQDKLLSRFEKEHIPVLLGTQMVAKGLDFENVTLAGVLQADLSLYMDHYRAAERTFSLLTQVAGRAGRGMKAGRAVIQTCTPDNDIIQAAAAQDYERFYHNEIRMRRVRNYPPFADLFTLTVSGTEEGVVMRGAVRVRNLLQLLCAETVSPDAQPEILGPAPAPVLKINRRYRYRVFLTGKNDKTVRQILSRVSVNFFRDRMNRGLSLFISCNDPG